MSTLSDDPRMPLPEDIRPYDILVLRDGTQIVHGCSGSVAHGHRQDGRWWGLDEDCFIPHKWDVIGIIRVPATPQPQPPLGLFNKYRIQKADGSPVDEGAEYFVLRLDRGGKDQVHVDACRAAVLEYAARIRSHLPHLAEDLEMKYGSSWIVDHSPRSEASAAVIPFPVQGDTVLYMGIDGLERPAMVTGVHSSILVNLHVFPLGVIDTIHGSYDEVPHCGPETHEDEPLCGPSWRWPPGRLQKEGQS